MGTLRFVIKDCEEFSVPAPAVDDRSRGAAKRKVDERPDSEFVLRSAGRSDWSRVMIDQSALSHLRPICGHSALKKGCVRCVTPLYVASVMIGQSANDR